MFFVDGLEKTLKKLKLGWNPYVDGPLRKFFKHQIKVDTNPWWLVPFSMIICIEINMDVSLFFWPTVDYYK